VHLSNKKLTASKYLIFRYKFIFASGYILSYAEEYPFTIPGNIFRNNRRMKKNCQKEYGQN